MADPPQYAIAPIDRCYELVGRIKLAWDGISGGPAVDEAVAALLRPAARAGGMSSQPASAAPPPLPDPEIAVLSAEPVELALGARAALPPALRRRLGPRRLHDRAER